MQQKHIYEQEHSSQPTYDGYHSYPPLSAEPGYEQWHHAYHPLSSPAHASYGGADFLAEKANIAAGLCYLGFWLTGFLFLLFERKNRFVRFHALQSLLFFGGINVLYIVLISIMVQQIPFVYGFAIFAFVIVNIVACVAWFVGMLNAFAGKYTKLPFVGDIAERYANQTSFVK